MPIRNILSDMEEANLQKRDPVSRVDSMQGKKKVSVLTLRWLVSAAWNLECMLDRKGYDILTLTSSWVSYGKSSPEKDERDPCPLGL